MDVVTLGLWLMNKLKLGLILKRETVSSNLSKQYCLFLLFFNALVVLTSFRSKVD